MKIIANLYFKFLLFWSIIMLIWGLFGFFEYFTGIIPFVHLQNKMYPDGLQFVHWLLISLTGAVFLFGYIRRWKWTPFAIIVLFSDLAVMCSIQTFDFMSEQWGISQYFSEMIFYIGTSLFLLFSSLAKSRFKPSSKIKIN
jgi:hypothetical protein